ncbi:MAG TPA: hypothetical protein VKE94_15585 [Gemmataceae bacterium]|nr:hypothetical protein [Gemmataceae bacterium]
MMLRNYFQSRVVVAGAFLGVAWLAAELSHAPAQQAGKGQERLNYEEKAYLAKANDIKQMLAGSMPADKKVLDLAAQRYAYRLTLTELQNKKDEMHILVRDVVNELNSQRREDRQSNEAVQILNSALVTRLREVLPNPRPIASINAAIILAHMAKIGHEEATEALAEALADPDMNGGTKVWAAKGLHDFFMLAFPTGEEQPVYFKDKEREARCIKALLTAFDVKLPNNPPPTPEEIDGLRVLRREIISALGATRYPALIDAKGASQGNSALTLIRALRNDGLNPSPRLDEQVEAAIGLAMMKTIPNKDYKAASPYQVDVAAYHLGRFIVDFARRHQSRKEDENKAHAQPWKTSAAHLSIALAALAKDADAFNKNDPTKNGKMAQYVKGIVKDCLPILKAIEADGDPRPDQLSEFLEKSQRDDEPIYKGDQNSVVKPGAAALSTEPAKEKKSGAGEKKTESEEKKKSGSEEKK